MTASLKLYEYTAALDVVREWVYEHDEEIRAAEGALPDELAELLESAEGDFKAKAENVALFIRELLSSAKAVKEEAERLGGRVRHYERAAEGLKAYLKIQMELADIQKVEGKLVTVRLQKSPPSVHAESVTQDDMKLIYDEYVRVIPESRMLNSAAIISHWKQTGESPIDGVTITQNLHLRIV